jgi:hypothetical protein
MSNKNALRYTTREDWLNAAIWGDTGIPKEATLAEHFKRKTGKAIPRTMRIACGFTGAEGNTHPLYKVLGVAWSKAASKDGHAEVFISPIVDDATEVLRIVTHELCHVVDENKNGHGKPFGALALAVGLLPPMRTTPASDELKNRFAGMLEHLGAYPHAALRYEMGRTGTKGKDEGDGESNSSTCRAIKCECPGCGYIVRTTRKWIENPGPPVCVGCKVQMQAEGYRPRDEDRDPTDDDTDDDE